MASNEHFSLIDRHLDLKLICINLSLREVRFDIYIYILLVFGYIF